MDALKQLLDKNYSNNKKAELVDLVTQIESLLGNEFDQILGITSEDIPKMTKKDLIATINTVKEHYEPEWEKKLASANKATTDVLQKIADLDNAFAIQAEDPAGNASDADFAAELGSIDFATIIGGPLQASITAQNQASLATVNFVKEVGFTEDDKIRMVDFSYTKTDEEGNEEQKELIVPFLSLLNVPSLRIENLTIQFHVKLNSTYTRNISSDFSVDSSLSAEFWSVKLDVSVAYQRSSSTGVEVNKEYGLDVKVVATNDEMPAGLEKVLGILAA